MAKNLEIFFSNRLEVLYQRLKIDLFGPSTTPLMRRLVVVYGPAMKTWLTLRMAQDPDLNVAMGIEFIYLNEAFETLLKLSTNETFGHFPTSIELALAIEKELMSVVYDYKNLSADEQHEWKPLIQYLKFSPNGLSPKSRLSRKIERRLIGLCQHLAGLFQDYGRFAPKMVSRWNLPSFQGWQARLWRQIFNGKMNWTYPCRALLRNGIPDVPFSLHFFSISFVTASEFVFLNQLSEHIFVCYYLLSPCAVFWSDIRSDRESAYLQNYWQKKLGTFSPKVCQLEELLRDRNPLLANFGRLGREMAYQIEESLALVNAQYVLPEHVKALDEELFINEELCLTKTSLPLSILHAVQADLLMMRNPQGSPPIQLEESQSVQLHIASNKRREVQILYQNLLGLIAKDPSLCPSDMIVMAPQISDYIPYIQSTFGLADSQLDFQVMDLGMRMQSEIVQGFLQLIDLCESRWNSSNLLQLFEHLCFQRRHQFTLNDYLIIQKWVEEAGIRWGEDWLHRNELLQRSHCVQGMVEETEVGTWDYGLSRLLMGLTALNNESESLRMPHEVPPCSIVDFSQAELLGKWIHLLHSLRDDLSPLEDHTRMTLEDWANFLACLLDNYFQPDFDNHQSIKEYEDLKALFDILRNSARFFKEYHYPFASIKTHLMALLQQRGVTYREDHLQAVRFCSLVPLRSIPAKVIALMGMQEGAFPRTEQHSSLNMMIGNEEVDYSPLVPDYDRYLFLEALHSAQDYLLLSYQGYSQQDGKEMQPSLIIEEFFSYLDRSYTVHGKKISDVCIFRHPFDTFDERYFIKNAIFPSNFSHHDFIAAKMHNKIDKLPSHCILNDFSSTESKNAAGAEKHSQIDLKHLTAVARNPIKFHLNYVMEIYLQTEEDRKPKTEEEFIVSALDKYQMKHFALKEPIDMILNKAEKEGKLPLGLFKEVAAKWIKEEVKEIHERLLKHSVNLESMFQFEFCTSCSQPTQLDEERWLFPAAAFINEDGHKISIVGKISNVTPRGLIVLSKGTLADAWKVWPQFLLYCHAAKLCPEKFNPQLILTNSVEPKKAFFEDPEPYLKQFVDYHSLCLQSFSPLVPEWIPFILQGDLCGLHDKMGQLFANSFGPYQNKDLLWILNKHRLPGSEETIHYWKAHAERLLGDMIRFWYNSELEKL